MIFNHDYGKIKITPSVSFTVTKNTPKKPKAICYYIPEEMKAVARYVAQKNPWAHGYESTLLDMENTLQTLIKDFAANQQCWALTYSGFRIGVEDDWYEDDVLHFRVGFLAHCYYDLGDEDQKVEIY